MVGLGAGRAPLTAACAPDFVSLKILFLEHHETTRQQTMMEKGIITFKRFSPKTFSQFFCKIVDNQLLRVNLTQYSVLLTRLHGCVAEETCKPAESLPVFR